MNFQDSEDGAPGKIQKFMNKMSGFLNYFDFNEPSQDNSNQFEK